MWSHGTEELLVWFLPRLKENDELLKLWSQGQRVEDTTHTESKSTETDSSLPVFLNVLKLFKPHTVGHQCPWVQLIHKLDRILTLVNREARRHSQGQLASPQTVLICVIQPLLLTVNACAVWTVCAFLSQRLVIKLLLGIGFALHMNSC